MLQSKLPRIERGLHRDLHDVPGDPGRPPVRVPPQRWTRTEEFRGHLPVLASATLLHDQMHQHAVQLPGTSQGRHSSSGVNP